MEGVRWAFSCGTWLPSRAEWLLAVRSIQPEEKERIGQFVFARDAKAAMVLQVFGVLSRGNILGEVGRAVETPSSLPSVDARVLAHLWPSASQWLALPNLCSRPGLEGLCSRLGGLDLCKN